MPRFIEVRGLEELRNKFRKYPEVVDQVMEALTEAEMLVLHENVPAYPPPPTGSTYKRTGMLGRSLGTSQGGSVSGQPDIFQTIKGAGFWEGRMGSRLGYAPRVIGETTQLPFFAAYWWRLVEVIAPSLDKITVLAETAAQKMADFLKGKGL